MPSGHSGQPSRKCKGMALTNIGVWRMVPRWRRWIRDAVLFFCGDLGGADGIPVVKCGQAKVLGHEKRMHRAYAET